MKSEERNNVLKMVRYYFVGKICGHLNENLQNQNTIKQICSWNNVVYLNIDQDCVYRVSNTWNYKVFWAKC